MILLNGDPFAEFLPTFFCFVLQSPLPNSDSLDCRLLRRFAQRDRFF